VTLLRDENGHLLTASGIPAGERFVTDFTLAG